MGRGSLTCSTLKFVIPLTAPSVPVVKPDCDMPAGHPIILMLMFIGIYCIIFCIGQNPDPPHTDPGAHTDPPPFNENADGTPVPDTEPPSVPPSGGPRNEDETDIGGCSADANSEGGGWRPVEAALTMRSDFSCATVTLSALDFLQRERTC